MGGISMHVTREQAILRDAEAAKIWNYITESSGASFSVAFAEVHGDHPESISNRSDRCYMFVQGDGIMKVGKDTYQVYGGDVVYIPKGTKHALSGNITYYLVNNPPFRKED